MRFSIAILTASLVCTYVAGPARAQVAPGAQQKTPAPAQHQPGTAAPAPPAASEGQPPMLEKPDPAKEAAIRHLMEITQTSKLGDDITNAITQQVRAVMSRSIQQPEELQKFMDDFTKRFTEAAPPSAVTDAGDPHLFALFLLGRYSGANQVLRISAGPARSENVAGGGAKHAADRCADGSKSCARSAAKHVQRISATQADAAAGTRRCAAPRRTRAGCRRAGRRHASSICSGSTTAACAGDTAQVSGVARQKIS